MPRINHTDLRHMSKANIAGVLFKPFVLPEERARHGGRNNQYVEQCAADEAGGFEAEQQQDGGGELDYWCGYGDHYQGQHDVETNADVAGDVGFAEGGGLDVVRYSAFVILASH